MHKKYKRLWAIGFLFVLLAELFLITMAPNSTKVAHASIPQISGASDIVGLEIVNSSRVVLELNVSSGQSKFPFTDDHPMDTTHQFTRGSNCTSKIDFDRSSWEGSGPTSFTLEWKYESGTGGCEDGGTITSNATITGADKRTYDAYQIDDDNIFMPQFRRRLQEHGTWRNKPISNGLFRHFPEDVSGYDDNLYPRWQPGADHNGYTFESHVDETRHAQSQWIQTNYSGSNHRLRAKACHRTEVFGVGQDECNLNSWDITIAPANTPIPNAYHDALSELGVTPEGDIVDPPEGDETEEDNSCEAAGDFAWLLCPVVFALSGAIEWTTTQISRLLEADRDKYTSPELYKAWTNIRNIALSLLIVLMLVMVIATALDTQMFDAYTVKRALPRMVAAIMFITLSWYICILLIDIFNALGSGIMGIMTGAFKPGGIELTDIFETGIGTFIASWLGVAGLIIGIILLMVFFGATILMFVGIAFLVLIIRQLFIILLLLLAPLAILSWIFPGNDKLWKLWWGSFSKLLMMYPLIMGLLAAGRIFAYLIQQTGGGSGGAQGFALDPLLALLAFTVPFAAIPMTFKFAGGMFATISGIANDKSKGMFDRAAKRRQAKAQRWAGGNAFKGAPTGSYREKFNKGTQFAANAKHYGGIDSLRHPSRIGSNIRSAIGEREFEHAMEAAEKTPGGKAFFASDDLMLAGLEGGGDREKTMNYLRGLETKDQNGRRVAKYSGAALDNMTNQVMRMRQQMGGDGFAIAALAKAPSTGTAFVGEEAGRWHQLIAQHTHGDGSLAASIVAQGKGGFRSAQRYEVSEAGFGDHMQAIQMAGTDRSSEGAANISNFLADKAYAGGGAGAVIGARNDHSAKMFAGAINRDIDRALDSGDQKEFVRAASRAASVQDQLGSGKRLVTDVIGNEVLGRDFDGTGETLATRIEKMQADPETLRVMKETRKEYSSSIAAADAATRAAQTGQPGGGIPPAAPGGPGPGAGGAPS